VKQIGVCSWAPHTIAVGGAGPFVRLFDLRSLAPARDGSCDGSYGGNRAAFAAAEGALGAFAPAGLMNILECAATVALRHAASERRRVERFFGPRAGTLVGGAARRVAARLTPGTLPDVSVSGLAFSGCRRELAVSYQGDQVYLVPCHAIMVAAEATVLMVRYEDGAEGNAI